MLERSAEVRFQGQTQEGMHGLEGLGWEGWRVVVVPGGWGVGDNPIPKSPQAANNNFVGWKV